MPSPPVWAQAQHFICGTSGVIAEKHIPSCSPCSVGTTQQGVTHFSMDAEEVVAEATARALAAGPSIAWVAVSVWDPQGQSVCVSATHTVLNAWRKLGVVRALVTIQCSAREELPRLMEVLGLLPRETPVLVVHSGTTALVNLSWDAWIGRSMMAACPVWVTAKTGAPVWGVFAGAASGITHWLRSVRSDMGMQDALLWGVSRAFVDADEEAGDLVWLAKEDGHVGSWWQSVRLPEFVGTLPSLAPPLRARLPHMLYLPPRKRFLLF